MALYNNYPAYGGYQNPMMQQNMMHQYSMQQPQIQQNTTMQAQTQPQIQNGGFFPVNSENEARNYPVAPGNSVTFKDENLPYIYVKTMGFSQLDRPVFEKFKLIKEEDVISQTPQQDMEIKPENNFVSREELEPFVRSIKTMETEIGELKNKISESRETIGKSNRLTHSRDRKNESEKEVIE